MIKLSLFAETNENIQNPYNTQDDLGYDTRIIMYQQILWQQWTCKQIIKQKRECGFGTKRSIQN